MSNQHKLQSGNHHPLGFDSHLLISSGQSNPRHARLGFHYCAHCTSGLCVHIPTATVALDLGASISNQQPQCAIEHCCCWLPHPLCLWAEEPFQTTHNKTSAGTPLPAACETGVTGCLWKRGLWFVYFLYQPGWASQHFPIDLLFTIENV